MFGFPLVQKVHPLISVRRWQGCMREKPIRKKLFVLLCSNVEKAETFYILHDEVALLTRRRSEP